MKQHAGIRRAVCAGLAVIWLLLVPLWTAGAETSGVSDYAQAENWAYFADGEDLAADVFVELLEHPGRYRFQSSLKT